MKKVGVIIIIIFFIFIVKINKKNQIRNVMKYEDDKNISYTYYLDYNDEVLSTNNFKLKISPLKYSEYVIRRIYPKYNNYEKKYYTYDLNYFNIDEIDNFKKDYIDYLRNNHLFEEIDKVNKNGVIIKGLEVYTTKTAILNYLKKYPKVRYKCIDQNYNSL